MEAPKGLPEMTALDVLSEASLQQNLCSRYERDEIYTSIGPLLVSLNPYKRLPIYEEEHMERYSRGKAAEPHLFRLGRLAVEEMVNASGVQSVLISGESGAGKTEATKVTLGIKTPLPRLRRRAFRLPLSFLFFSGATCTAPHLADTDRSLAGSAPQCTPPGAR